MIERGQLWVRKENTSTKQQSCCCPIIFKTDWKSKFEFLFLYKHVSVHQPQCAEKSRLFHVDIFAFTSASYIL